VKDFINIEDLIEMERILQSSVIFVDCVDDIYGRKENIAIISITT
jgi:hypothetical protein